MESHWNILGKGKNLTFSEQQLVDCAGAYSNHGCNGGLPSQAFEYIRSTQGLESDKTYPYTGKDGKCVYRPAQGIAYNKYGSYNITQGDETELAERLFSVGPISIAFDVITGFQNYHSGVYSTRLCGKTAKNVNHAVLATGYGTESSKKFWNVKNSWGPTWGEKGYFKIERDVNMCAISQCNSYPLIDKANTQGLEEIM
jgi:cathepsin H